MHNLNGLFLKLENAIFKAYCKGNFDFFKTNGFVSILSVGKESFIIFPSSISIILSPYFKADCKSWETTITNFSLLISFNILNICSLDFLSKLPVGSSASIIKGSLIKALAIAILCF